MLIREYANLYDIMYLASIHIYMYYIVPNIAEKQVCS